MSTVIITYGKDRGRDDFLIPLRDHDDAVLEWYHRIKHSNLNGIECPNCKNELQDCGKGVMLSYPPQMDIICIECGWKGRRYC